MKRREFINKVGLAAAAVPVAVIALKTVSESGGIWMLGKDMPIVNANFEQLSRALKFELEMIDCGQEPNDGRGESLRSGMQKINRNFKAIAEHMGGKP